MLTFLSPRVTQVSTAMPCLLQLRVHAASTPFHTNTAVRRSGRGSINAGRYTLPVPLARAFSTTRLHQAAVNGWLAPSSVLFRASSNEDRHGGSAHHRNAPPHLPQRRLHGTVTAYKHRRGYGFVLAEGIVPSSLKSTATTTSFASTKSVYAPLETLTMLREKQLAQEEAATAAGAEDPTTELHKTYFFFRTSMDGGFYVTEGERVSFTVEKLKPRHGDARRRDSGSAAHHDGEGDSTLDAMTGDGEAGAEREYRAASLLLYNPVTGAELPITPITIHGEVVEWDEERNCGLIAELDTERQSHPDAPRFRFAAEDVDITPGTSVFVGRYVRFCLGPASVSAETATGTGANASPEEETATDSTNTTTAEVAAVGGATDSGELVARRVIIDYGLEKRRGGFGRPLAPVNADPRTVSALTRFRGVVREVRNGSFGFIVDDLSGESIFYHTSNARPNVSEGDRVTYLLREVVMGRHAGRKACLDVRRAASSADGATDVVSAVAGEELEGTPARKGHDQKRTTAVEDEDDLEFDLLR